MTDLTARDNGKFKKGTSGNPTGRPRTESARIREALNEHSEMIVNKLIEKIEEGDIQAMKMALDRISPSLKPITQPSPITLDKDASLSDMANAIIQQSLSGNIEPQAGAVLLSALEKLKPIQQAESHLKRCKEFESMDSMFGF
jgi:hypothetical protein